MRELEREKPGCRGVDREMSEGVRADFAWVQWVGGCLFIFVVFLLTLGHPPLVLRCVGGQPMFVYILLGVYVWRLAGWLAGWLPELLL